jgi:acyl dehydratase
MKVENEKVHAKPYTLAQLSVGQTYKKSWAITAELIEGFARVTGDYNPIHLDEDYARQTVFKKHKVCLGPDCCPELWGVNFRAREPFTSLRL